MRSQLWVEKMGFVEVDGGKVDRKMLRVFADVNVALERIDDQYQEKTVLFFPTARNSFVGMEEELLSSLRNDEKEVVLKIYKSAADILYGDREKYKNVFINRDDLKSGETIAVLKTFVHLQAMYTAYKLRYPEFKPGAMTGMSSGMVNAFVAAGFFDFEETLRFLQKKMDILAKHMKREDVRRDKIVISNCKKEDIDGVIDIYNKQNENYGNQRNMIEISNDFGPSFIVLYVKQDKGNDLDTESLVRDLKKHLTENARNINAANSILVSTDIVPSGHGYVYSDLMESEIRLMLQKLGRNSVPTARVISSTKEEPILITSREEALEAMFDPLGNLKMANTVNFIGKNFTGIIEMGIRKHLLNVIDQTGTPIAYKRFLNGLMEPIERNKLYDNAMAARLGLQLRATSFENQFNNVGGIDLNPDMLDLQIKRDPNGVPLPISQQDLEHMQIEGFFPIIIDITPINGLPELLGLSDQPVEEMATL